VRRGRARGVSAGANRATDEAGTQPRKAAAPATPAGVGDSKRPALKASRAAPLPVPGAAGDSGTFSAAGQGTRDGVTRERSLPARSAAGQCRAGAALLPCPVEA
jgi:hypothetical protein